MISRDELMKDLKNDLNFEEEIIGKISVFYKALGWKSEIDKKYHNDIENGLITLKKDSEKHARLIKEMIEYIERSDKSEY